MGKQKVISSYLLLFLLIFIVAGCVGKGVSGEVSGNYIDIREQSSYYDYAKDGEIEELNNDNLPKGNITKSINGGTKGTPVELGNTLVYKEPLGEELGISIQQVVRGKVALNIVKKEFDFLDNPPEGMEYLILDIKFTSYDSMNEPYPVSAVNIEIWSDSNDLNKYEGEFLRPTKDAKENLKTGESTVDGIGFLVPKGSNNLFAVYKFMNDEPYWFSLK